MNLLALLLALQAPDTAARVRELAAKADWAALDDLVDLGPAAAAHLEPLAKDDKTGRLACALDQIRFEERMKPRGVRPPKRISVKCENKKSFGVFTDLLRDAGESFDLSAYDPDDQPGAEITLDLKGQTFWRAIDAVCAEARTRIDFYSSPSLDPDDWRDAPRFIFRNFLVRLDGMQMRRTVNFRGPPTSTATFDFYVFADSGAGALHYDSDVRIDAAEDDQGRSLLLPPEPPSDPPAEPGWTSFTTDAMASSVPIAAPAKDAKALRLVRGRVLLAYAKKDHRLAFDRMDAGTTCEAAGLKFELLALEQPDRRFGTSSVRFRVTGAEEKLKAFTDAQVVPRVQLEEGSGTGTAAVSRSKDGVELRVHVGERQHMWAGERRKLVVKSVELQLIEELEVRPFEFEFRDVKLP